MQIFHLVKTTNKGNGMSKFSPANTISLFVALIAALIVLSIISVRLWGGKPETIPEPKKLTINKEMTLQDFAQINGLPNRALKEIFGLQQKSDLQKNLSEYGSDAQIKALVTKKLALVAEHETKNWKKIVIKFAVWFAVLSGIFILFRKQKVSPFKRKLTLLFSALIFGVVLSADPSPMGTVKDAIHLFATSGAVFPPPHDSAHGFSAHRLSGEQIYLLVGVSGWSTAGFDFPSQSKRQIRCCYRQTDQAALCAY